MPPTNPCLDYFATFYRAVVDAYAKGRGWIPAQEIKDATADWERRMLSGTGAQARFAENFSGMYRLFAKILGGVAVPGELFGHKYPQMVRRVENTMAALSTKLGLIEKDRLGLTTLGLSRYDDTDQGIARIMNVVWVKDLRALPERPTRAAIMDAARRTAERTGDEATIATVSSALDKIPDKYLPELRRWPDHFYNAREEARQASTLAMTQRLGRLPTEEELEAELGPTLPAYITHAVRQMAGSELVHGEEFNALLRAAPWTNEQTTSLLWKNIEAALSARQPGTQGADDLGRAVSVLFPKQPPSAASYSTSELFEEMFPGFHKLYPTTGERAQLYHQLAGMLASTDGRAAAVAKLFPDKLFVRWYLDRKTEESFKPTLLGAIDGYFGTVYRKAAIEPVLPDVKAAIKAEINEAAATGTRASVMEWFLRDFYGHIVGQQRPLMPEASRALAHVTKLAYAGTLLGNVSAAFVNSTQPMFTIAEYGIKDAIAGWRLWSNDAMREIFTRKMAEDIAIRSTPFQELQPAEALHALMQSPDLPTALRRAKNFGVAVIDLMSRAEYLNTSHAFFTGVARHLRESGLLEGALRGEGISQISQRVLEEAANAGNLAIEKTQFSFLASAQPMLIRQLNRFPGAPAFTMFTNYPIHAANLFVSWTRDALAGESRAIRMEGWMKLGRLAFMGNLIAGPFWFAPWLRGWLEDGEEGKVHDALKVMSSLEEHFSVAGWMGVDLANRISLFDPFTSFMERFGLGKGQLLTPLPRFIEQAFQMVTTDDPFERQVAEGRVLGPLAPLFGGRAPANMPSFSLPPTLAPMFPAGVQINKMLRLWSALSDPDRQTELGTILQLDERGRPRAVTSLSQELRRQFSTPIEELKIALRGRAAKSEADQLDVMRQDIKRNMVEGKLDEVYSSLQAHPELAEALEPDMLNQERTQRGLLPQARAFKTSPLRLAAERYQQALERLQDPNLSPAERVLEQQIVLVGTTRFRRPGRNR